MVVESGDDASPLFTVLLPVNRPPDLLRHAIRSVLAQSLGDFELIVLCDGAPAETVAAAKAFAADDPRVVVRAFEKGEAKGERWRHRLLSQARGRHCCQIGDDDIWFPNHLAEAATLLETADFGNLLFAGLDGQGMPMTYPGDLADPRCRRRLLEERFNFFGPTCAAYRLRAYRSLATGWEPPPEDVWSDLNMWRKFLRQTRLVCETRFAVTALCLPNDRRVRWRFEQRVAEHERLAALADDPDWRAGFVADILRRYLVHYAGDRRQDATTHAVEQAEEATRLQQAEAAAQAGSRRIARLEARLAYVERSRLWRLRQRLAGWLGRP